MINLKQFAKIITISCLVAAVSCAQFPRGPHAASSQINPQAVAAPGSTADSAAKAAAQQAKLHYVEIGPSLKGDYKFGYDTGSGPAGQSFREETRLDDGTVKGAYGYVDANGKQRIVKYTAGKNGFVVEGDQEAPGQAAAASAQQAPEPVRRPQPVAAPQPAQPNFDEAPAPVQINRAQAPVAEDRARAEQQHAEQLRQHQLAQQAALAQQQQLAQRLQLQQQQQLAAEARRQQAQAQPQPQQQPQQQQQQQQLPQPQFVPHHEHAHQQQPHGSPVHQTVDPQTGTFFSSSSDGNLQQLLNQQLRQLQSGSQFAGQFQPPQPSSVQQQPQIAAPQASPAFLQAPQQFASQQSPQDFAQFRGARQASPNMPQQFQQNHQHQANLPQSALLALHQQQQHDAQLLSNLRAQQLARIQEQARQQQSASPAQQAPPQFSTIVEAPQQPRQQSAAPQPQQIQRVAPQPLATGPISAQPVTPQPESFGPPVIDIRTLNYSIGQQTRV